jgi:hypothetical protein
MVTPSFFRWRCMFDAFIYAPVFSNTIGAGVNVKFLCKE